MQAQLGGTKLTNAEISESQKDLCIWRNLKQMGQKYFAEISSEMCDVSCNFFGQRLNNYKNH